MPEPERELELLFDTEPIVGWRVWNIGVPSMDWNQLLDLVGDAIDSGNSQSIRNLKRMHLGSLTVFSKGWPGLKKFQAKCDENMYYPGTKHLRDNHEAPVTNCVCGIWALKKEHLGPSILQYAYHLRYAPFAYGEVYLWGYVIEAEKGYRAGYAYPKNLTLVNTGEKTKADIESMYGVPVQMGEWQNEWNPSLEDSRPTTTATTNVTNSCILALRKDEQP